VGVTPDTGHVSHVTPRDSAPWSRGHHSPAAHLTDLLSAANTQLFGTQRKIVFVPRVIEAVGGDIHHSVHTAPAVMAFQQESAQPRS